MPNYNAPHREDCESVCRSLGTTMPDGATTSIFGPRNGADYEHALQEAFQFFRRHDDGRYSSRMKMRLLDAAGRAESLRLGNGARDDSLPGVVRIEVPFAFDEETEVKTGGVLGMAVVWHSDSGKVMVAVNNQHRRKRIGSYLLWLLTYTGNQAITAWVNQRNVAAQHFLLQQNFVATGINQSGGVCWTRGRVEAEGQEDNEPSPFE